MKSSQLVSIPARAGSALRHRRLFDPIGVLAHGRLDRRAPAGAGLPVESGAVVGRISKGLGTPDGMPDFAGLAWRMTPAPFAATPWDVLLVSAGVGHLALVPNRVLLRPVISWAQADYSSLMPLRHRGRLWWIRARLVDPVERSGLTLPAVRDQIAGPGLRFTIEQACGTDDFGVIADLVFTELISGEQERLHDVAFDPVRHTARDVVVWPQWLRDLREAAYAGSRQGRADQALVP